MSNEISVQASTNVPANIQIRSGPIYLIELLENKKTIRFIATKIDEHAQSINCIGFYSDDNDMTLNPQETVKNAETDQFINVSFPWHRILSVQNLIYKHKGNK